MAPRRPQAQGILSRPPAAQPARQAQPPRAGGSGRQAPRPGGSGEQQARPGNQARPGKKREPKVQKLGGLTKQQNDAINQRQDADLALGNVANNQLGQIEQSYSQPFDWEAAGAPMESPNWEQYGPPPSAPDWSGIPEAPVSGDFNDWRQQQIDSTYGDFTKRMEPQFQQQTDDFHQQMANRGIPMGSELYNKEKTRLEQSQNDARSSAMVQAQAISGANAGQFAGIGFQARDQATGEIGQRFGQANQAHSNAVNQGLLQYQSGNDAFDRRLGYQMQQRNLPLNEFNAIWGSTSPMAGQNLSYSQGRSLQDDEQSHQRWMMRNTPRGGGGGGAAPPSWVQAGFGSFQDMAAWEDARNRANQQFNWENNPQFRTPKGPSSGSVIGGQILGTGLGILGGYAASNWF